MKCISFKYLLIICIAAAFLMKVCNVAGYVKFAKNSIEYASVHEDATEKEEKKIETEYFTDQFCYPLLTERPQFILKKAIMTNQRDHFAYFPEVLTPPPAV